MRFLILCLCIASTAFTSTIQLPDSFKPILECPEFLDTPEFLIAEKKGTFFVAFNLDTDTQLIELEKFDPNPNYIGYRVKNIQDKKFLGKFMDSVYTLNNTKDIVTGGYVYLNARDEDQACYPL